MNLRSTPTAIAIALALTLACSAYAQSTDADERALTAARADLERAAQRVAELSRKLGHPERGPVVIEHRVARKPVLGVLLAPDPQAGVRIAGVTPDGAAAKAGLLSGDRIVSIDGTAIAGGDGTARTDQARALLGNLGPEKPVALGYERAGARASVKVTPRIGERVVVLRDAPGNMRFGGNIRLEERVDGRVDVEADTVDVVGPEHAAPPARKVIRHDIRQVDGADVQEFVFEPAPGVAPQVHREIIRLGRGGECKGEDCMLAEAFRWNGLNLASVGAQLGRYFGTDHGVLLLSTPQKLGDLQPGDVVQKVDGQPVTTPREVMKAMHARAAGTSVPVEYLRDRKRLVTSVALPKAMPLRFPAPPLPPAAPAPPAPPPAMKAPTPAPAPVPPPPPPPALSIL